MSEAPGSAAVRRREKFDRVNAAIKELWACAEEAGLSVLSNPDEADDGTPQVVLTLEGRWPDGV